MTKKHKIGCSIGIFFGTLTLCGTIFGIMGIFYNPYLAYRMVKYYSNDNNYLHITANIKKVDEWDYSEEDISHYFYLDNIFVIETGDIWTTNHAFHIYSLDIKNTLNELNPSAGLEIECTVCDETFWPTFPFPVVQVSCKGKEILCYEDGKSALLRWAATVR